MRKLNIPEKCPECEGTMFYWNWSNVVNSGVPTTGVVYADEVHPELFIGCEECSATVFTVRLDDFVNVLNINWDVLFPIVSKSTEE